MSEFRKAKQTLIGHDKAQKAKEKEVAAEYTWNDAEDAALNRKLNRKANRIDELNRLVPKRICRVCDSVKIHWVINRRHTMAICKSCWTKLRIDKRMEEDVKHQQDAGIMFVSKEMRYRIDGAAIFASRTMVNLRRSEFAKRAGWSAAWQQKIETGNVITVSKETAEVILQVLSEEGFISDETL